MRRGRRSGGWWLAGAASLAMAWPAPGQSEAPAPREGEPPAEPPVEPSDATPAEARPPAPARPARDYEAALRAGVSARLARTAMLTLRQTPLALPSDYALTAAMLDEALALTPGDEELLRRRAEALMGAGDRAGVEHAMRELALVAPDDTVTQLAVVTARISALQDADARLAAYDRLLSPAGEALDPSVRSRLAFDAALLAREIGDDSGFARRLLQATQLDSTNKAAAAMAAGAFLARIEDPLGRVELLANVVLADPLDEAAHLNLSKEFLRQGALSAAARFLDHAITLRREFGQNADDATLVQRYALLWALEGPEAVLETLRKQQETAEARVAEARRAAEAEGTDPAEIPDFRPNPHMVRVQMTIGAALDDAELVDRSMRILGAYFLESGKRVQERLESEDTTDRAQLAEVQQAILAESVQARLLADSQLEQAALSIHALRSTTGAARIRSDALQRHEGWYAARTGAYDVAVRLLEPLAARDTVAMLGLGVAAEEEGKRREAAVAYARVALTEPGSLMGLFARTRLERMLGQPVAPTAAASSLEAYAEGMPEWIDRMVESPESFIRLEAAHVSDTIDRLGRDMVRLTLRNVAPIAVGVGEEAPIRSSVLLAPRLSLGQGLAIETVRPEVVNLDRRLRLAPQEAFEAVVWADQGETGAVLDVQIEPPATLRWRVIQGFSIDEEARYVTGPMSLSAETDLARRSALSPLGESAEIYAEALQAAQGETLLETLLLVRTALSRAGTIETADAAQIRADLGAGVAARIPAMSDLERVFTLLVMPAPWGVPESAVIDEAAAVDPSPLVSVALATRAAGVDDPNLLAAIQSPDPHVSAIGRLLHTRLTTARPGAVPAEANDTEPAGDEAGDDAATPAPTAPPEPGG